MEQTSQIIQPSEILPPAGCSFVAGTLEKGTLQCGWSTFRYNIELYAQEQYMAPKVIRAQTTFDTSIRCSLLTTRNSAVAAYLDQILPGTNLRYRIYLSRAVQEIGTGHIIITSSRQLGLTPSIDAPFAHGGMLGFDVTCGNTLLGQRRATGTMIAVILNLNTQLPRNHITNDYALNCVKALLDAYSALEGYGNADPPLPSPIQKNEFDVIMKWVWEPFPSTS